LNGYTIYFLIISNISALSCIIFSGTLLKVLLRKRTMGTLLLWITFLSTTLAEIILAISFHLETFLPKSSIIITTEALSFTSYLLFAFNIVLIYAFGNRLILKDNDFVRLVYLVGFTFTLAFPAGMIYQNILKLRDPSLYTKIVLEAANLSIVMPTRSIALFVILAPLGISAFLRIVIKAIRIQRGTKDRIAKEGFRYIWQGTFLWYTGYTGLFALLWYVPVFSSNPILLTFIFTFKLVFSDLVGFLFLYLGWVMPDGLKRRLSAKAWIAKVYSGEIKATTEKETARSYIATGKQQQQQQSLTEEQEHQDQQSNSSTVIEVSDR